MPFIRECTVYLLTGLNNNDILGQVNRVVNFVKSHVTYVRDPVGSEYVVSPVRMLESYRSYGYMAGDCDDHVMLLNSMLGSIGIQTKFLGVKFGDSPVYNHVISGVMINGQLYQVDPCAKGSVQPTYSDVITV